VAADEQGERTRWVGMRWVDMRWPVTAAVLVDVDTLADAAVATATAGVMVRLRMQWLLL
jgi:hypothetical protein